MSWKPLTEQEREEVTDVYKTFKTGRDSLWAAVKRKYPESEISQRTILNDFLVYQVEHQTHQKPMKPASIAPIFITKPGYLQCDNVSMRSYSDSGYLEYFHMIDGFTKKSWGRPLRTEEEEETTAAAKSCIEQALREGAKISVMQCDNGSTFQSVFRDMLSSFGIKQVYSRPHNPQANAFVEVRGSTIRRQLFAMMEAAGDRRWVKNFQLVLDNINESKSQVTGFSPNDLEKGSADQQAAAVASISARLDKRHKLGAVSTPLYIGQKCRLKRIRGRYQKPGLLGYWSTPIYTVVQRVNSTYANMLPSYRVADEHGKIQYGRYPKTSLLKIPPILTADQVEDGDNEGVDEAEGGAVEETDMSHVVDDVLLPSEPAANELVPTAPSASQGASAPRRSLRINRPGEYEADFIVGKKGRGRTLQYKVRWKGYNSNDDTWEPLRNLANCKDLIAEYEQNHTAQARR